jgi:hypothetical protein
MRKSLHTGLTAGMLAMGIIAAPSFAEIKVNDQLSLSGFIDMSAYYNTQVFVFPGFTGTSNEPGATLDQFELDFMYKFSDVLSARVDLSNSAVEQGFISYAASSKLTVQAGKFLSSSGWEAAEPTGMYQYDYSDAFVYGGYQNGVNVSYAVSPMISLYAALVDGIWTADGSLKRPGLEGQVALMPTKEVTVKVTGMYEQQPGYGKTVLNAWGAYVAGPLTAAVEADYLMNYTAEDDNGIGYLLMANYKLSDALAVTGRFSGMKTDAMPDAQQEVTVSPSYTLAPNWLILAQAKYQLEPGEIGYAVETTVTF